jgi:hypothetical protein
MSFLYNIKQKFNFTIKIYSPPFTNTKIINDRKYFFNKIEHYLKNVIDPEIVSKILYDFIKNNNKDFYFSNNKPCNMHNDVYKKEFYTKILNNLSTFTYSELGLQYKSFFDNIYNELYDEIISSLEKNKLYYQYSNSILNSYELKKKIISTVSKYSSTNNKVIININVIKKLNYDLYLELTYIYKKLAIDLSKKYNIKLNCVSNNSVESIDIYYYPNNIFIKNHKDIYQKSNEFKFNTIIESNYLSPMYILYNNIKIYPKTDCGILARLSKITHGVDLYKNTNRYLLQFIFESDIKDDDYFIYGIFRKFSKILRYLGNIFNISNNKSK